MGEEKFDSNAAPTLFHRQKKVLSALKRGEVDDIRASHALHGDSILKHAIQTNLLKKLFESFSDPRKRSEVPIEIILVSQILQKLHSEHSMLLAPYMLNDASLMAQ